MAFANRESLCLKPRCCPSDARLSALVVDSNGYWSNDFERLLGLSRQADRIKKLQTVDPSQTGSFTVQTCSHCVPCQAPTMRTCQKGGQCHVQVAEGFEWKALFIRGFLVRSTFSEMRLLNMTSLAQRCSY